MKNIAVAGENKDSSIVGTLLQLFKLAEFSVFRYESNNYKSFDSLKYDAAHIFIAPIDFYPLEKVKHSVDVFVFGADAQSCEKRLLNIMSDEAIIIMNNDNKAVYKYLSGSTANIITYGFNSKASVTASSVEQSSDQKFIQFCIQRSFRTVYGVTVDAQEIPVTLTYDKDADVLNELAAITCAISCGVQINTLSSFAYI